MKTLFSPLLIIAGIFCIGTHKIIAQHQKEEVLKSDHIYAIKAADSLHLYTFQKAQADSSKSAAIIIFHGGGWSSGKASWGFGLAQQFAKKGITAISVQYRMSNQTTISPIDAIEDATDAIIWVREYAEELQINPKQVIAYGWSAGAHLAAATATLPQYSSDSLISSIPNGLILSSPALSVIKDNWFNQLLPEGAHVTDYSPVENITTKLPPSLILVGAEDTVTPKEQAMLFYKKALEYGSKSTIKVYDDVGHLFTPSSKPDDGRPAPDQATVEKVHAAIDAFLEVNKFL